jgi:SagB-type dehydrogenase family enzyme
MYVNPYLFFIIKNGEYVIWDYLNHRQYVVESAYIERLKLWSLDQISDQSEIDNDLKIAELISERPYEKYEWGWDDLSKIFHIGTRNIANHLLHLSKEEWIDQYLSFCKSIAETPPILKTEKNGKQVISLPEPNFSLLEDIKYIDVVKKRKTSRSFNKSPLELDILNCLLYISLGPLHDKWEDLENNNLRILGRRKSFPSAGGLHPEEAYIVSLNIEGLLPGIYHYNSVDHNLLLINDSFSESELIPLLQGQYFAEGLSAGIFLTSRFEKTWWKYPHSRGYRMSLIDNGHASQSILLTATALGLDTWMTGAFSDCDVEKVLKIETFTEQPLFFIGIGYGDNATLDSDMLNQVHVHDQ